MILIMAVSLAVMANIVLEMVLDLLFSNRIRLMQRLDDVKNLERLQEIEGESGTGLTKQIFSTLLNRILEIIETLIPRDQRSLQRVDKQLKQAGLEMTPVRYGSLLIFRMIFGGVFCGIFAFLQRFGFRALLFSIVFGLYAGYGLSRYFLKKRIARRREEMYHQLPEVMDLLSVSVAAGLGFDQAVAYVVEKSEGALIDELEITRKEMLLGVSRKEALEGFAERCENVEISTFVTAVTQSEEMGASIKDVLHVQAETIRETHKQQVEEKAQKLPVKMLLPLVLFIFPTIFIVILGPALLTIMKEFGA
ncbi:MAG: type II secretion system F family protein [Johnsonella sp.]|nr:type II secretion system F family protein [Johnsonella sp.]